MTTRAARERGRVALDVQNVQHFEGKRKTEALSEQVHKNKKNRGIPLSERTIKPCLTKRIEKTVVAVPDPSATHPRPPCPPPQHAFEAPPTLYGDPRTHPSTRPARFGVSVKTSKIKTLSSAVKYRPPLYIKSDILIQKVIRE